MTLAGIYRYQCEGLVALVADIDVVPACGITCDRTWWCECGVRIDGSSRYVRITDVCEHLRTFGLAPAGTAQ